MTGSQGDRRRVRTARGRGPIVGIALIALIALGPAGCAGTPPEPLSERATTGATAAVDPAAVAEVHTLAEGDVHDPMLAVDRTTDTVYAVWTAQGTDGLDADHTGHDQHAAHHHGHAGHEHHVGDPETTSRILLAVSSDGGRTFSPPVRVDGPDPVEGFAADPRSDRPTQVLVTPDAAVHVVWVATRPVEGQPRPANDLRIATSRDGGRTFATPRAVVPTEQAAIWNPGFHRAIVAPDGAIHIAFLATPEEGGTDGRSVRVATSRDVGASFQVGEALTTSTCQCCPVSMAANDEGRVTLAWRHIFWQEDGSPLRDIAVAFSDDGADTWGSLAPVHEDGWLMEGCPHTGPALATGPDGRLHVAWYTGREADPGVRYTVEEAPERFAEPTILASDGFFPLTQPSLEVADDGTAWVAWDDLREDEPAIRLGQVTPDGDLVLDDEPLAAGRHPRVAVTTDTVLVTWANEGRLQVAVLDGTAS